MTYNLHENADLCKQGFGLLAPGLSLSTGLTVCFLPSSIIPNGNAAVKLLGLCDAKSIMTVPSILEEIANLPEDQIKVALAPLQFVIWGGGPLKVVVGERLAAAGINLLNHSGATEVGALGSVFVPGPDYDWRYIRVRKDFDLQFNEVQTPSGEPQRYKMTAHPFGWDETFELQDQLITRPEKPGVEFQILGRDDDLIVLATGEKVLPQTLESLLTARSDVKAAVAFGEGELELGVVVEPSIAIEDEKAFKSAIWPTIVEAGEKMDSHAQISSTMAIIVVQAGTCPRSDKGSIMRKETYRLLNQMIATTYKDLENNTDGPRVVSSSSPHLEQDLKDVIISVLDWKGVSEELAFDSDFFELGMDSLQALKLRRALLPSLLKGSASAKSVENVGRSFLYRYPSVASIADFMRGTEEAGTGLSKQTIIDGLAETYFATFLAGSDRVTILLTGSTGSLGSHLVAHLSGLPAVAKVICLVRAKGNSSTRTDAHERQIQALISKRLSLSEEGMSKVEVLETNAANCYLGLTRHKYKELCENVTHILHNAWPVDFKRHLPSFEGQFHTISNLVQLARKAKITHRTVKPKMVFVSSIATVGRYGKMYGSLIVPEVPIKDVNCTSPFGYAEAKLVCEKILDRTSEAFGDELDVQYVRVGQMAGSKVTGYWNSTEHLPALLKSSQKIGALPRIKGVSLCVRDTHLNVWANRWC
jgi:Male sterility protein/Phosphopantetheine attachment site